MGLVVVIVILISTWRLLKDSFKMSVDAVPTGMELENIKQVILKVKDVTGVRHVHIWAMSTTENALTAHVCITDSLPFENKLTVLKNVKHELLHHNVQHSTLELENENTKAIHEH